MTKYFIPTKEQIQSYQIGDLAPNCFGKFSPITEIYAREQDINGKWFICYYVRYGENATISHSLKEGELDRWATHNWKSFEMDEIESHLLGQGRKYPLMALSNELKAELERIS